ncbi:patatin-like phospholipase family protein [uncultured Tateyamaria sp.]|uniref:patatin-like phospholipase family protein n=1 Tax=uncultured Tateyamaria sp. TaxID=455651 RepID=UPI00262C00E2|nr:patatin-like phospholipase family protein [uncultured Tateyamaria sp.]
MKDERAQAELIALLHDIEGFSALSPDILEQMAQTAAYRDVARGEALITEGEAADTLYIVLRGRFTVLSGGRAIAEIPMGEPIGELAFFAGGTRTATVVAARDSLVMCLTRAAYDALAARTPALANGILAAVSQRLARTIPASPCLRPEAGQVCAVFPAAGGQIDPAFMDGVRRAFDPGAGWRVLDVAACPEDLRRDPRAMSRWLDAQEAEHGNLLLLCPDPEAEPTWAAVTANNCDAVYLVMPKAGRFSPDQGPSPLERQIYDATLSAHLHLVLHRPTFDTSTTGTAQWLAERPVGLHHHVALDRPDDFARLARFMRGEAVGLVLCGGGSFGTAHLGVIKSLQEHGYSFDFVGGTSVGSAMAGALAIGLHPDEIMEQCEDIFLKSKAMSRLTVPRYSLLDHHRLDEAFRKHYGAFDVEDLPVNFFAVSTNLTHNDVTVIRSGPLWQAIRASTAIPGVFPPFVRDDGEVLIDGGLIDNVPLTAMRDAKPGPNVVLNFMPGKPWTVRAKYEDLPNRMEALTSLLRKPRKGVPRYPTAFAVLARAMVVNARKLLRQIDVGADVLLNISVLRGMSFMSWKRGRELFEASYAQMDTVLSQIPEQEDALARLRAASDVINADLEADTPLAPVQPRRSTITEPTE